MTEAVEIEQVDRRHNEFIICPKCEAVQIATVLHTWPWNIMVHDCTKCGYIIMESEWERVNIICSDCGNPAPHGLFFTINRQLCGSCAEKYM
jgi:ribosomal protein S27AE